MRAREIMTSPVTTVRLDTSVQDAAALLTEHGITSLPVLDEDERVVGIVSEIDLIRSRMPHDPRAHLLPEASEQPDPAGLVREVMTDTVVCLPDTADAADLAELMVNSNVRAIPIVDGSHLIGIVSRRDLLRTLLRDDDAIKNEVSHRLNDYAADSNRRKVEVAAGIVTIHGHFDDVGQQHIVTLLARTVPGVIRVHLQHHRTG